MVFDIDLKFRVSIDGEAKACLGDERLEGTACLGNERLEGAISAILSSWSDGRYPFNIEMIQRGVRGVVEGAVAEIANREMRRVHGDLMVDSSDGRSSTAKAVLEANKLLGDLRVRLVDELEDVVSVTTVGGQPKPDDWTIRVE